MRVLLTGGSGQLGQELQKLAPSGWEIVAPPRTAFDLADPAQVARNVADLNPTHILHAGAWTAVDAAEEAPDAAHTVNAESTAALAQWAAQHNAQMLYVSTDFVFGDGHDRPIAPDATPAPLSVYGATKHAGERAMVEHLGDRALIVRTSWVYAAHGSNFMRTMLRLMGERDTLRVVADQISAPTAAPNLAKFCAMLLDQGLEGTWHYSDAGSASWYDFACAIYAQGRIQGLLEHDVAIHPIATEAYPTPATRPRYSLLDRSASWALQEDAPMHWRDALRDVMGGLRS